jgi:hypothetical protein
MIKNLYYALGAVLLVVGLMGFAQNPILGLFEVNTLHNVIHLATGLALLAAAMKGDAAIAMCSKILGVVYAIVAVLGFATGNIFGLMDVNMPDNGLHLLLALVFLYVGFMKKPEVMGTMGTV